jgi:hypothetical protein
MTMLAMHIFELVERKRKMIKKEKRNINRNTKRAMVENLKKDKGTFV